MRRILLVPLLVLSTTTMIVLAHPHSATAAAHTVAIDGAPDCGASRFCYNPSSLTVTVGDTVTWVNDSVAPHTVTPCEPSTCSGIGPGSVGRDGPFSPTIHASGGSFAFTFTRPGSYNYYCAKHCHMMTVGTITVVPGATTITTIGGTISTTLPSRTATRTRTQAASTSQSVDAATHTVSIDGTPDCGTSMFCYNPSSLTVTTGDTVTWVNNSTAPHTVTRCDPSACSGNGPGSGGQSGPSSPTINPSGGTFSFTFTSPGTYLYYCEIHGYAMMHGTITVTAATTPTTVGTTSTTAASSSTTGTTTGVTSATSGPSASSPGVGSTAGPASQLAGTGIPASQEIVIGLLLLLLGLGLMAPSTTRRRPLRAHLGHGSHLIRSTEDVETESSNPTQS